MASIIAILAGAAICYVGFLINRSQVRGENLDQMAKETEAELKKTTDEFNEWLKVIPDGARISKAKPRKKRSKKAA